MDSPAEVRSGAVIELSRRERAARFHFGQAAWAPKPAMAFASRVFEAATRRAALRLSSYAGTAFQSVAGETQQVPFERYGETVAPPAFLACLRTEKDCSPAILRFSPELVSGLLGVMLGDEGDCHGRPPQLTDIQRHVLGAVVQTMAEELRQAWGPNARLGFEPESVETVAEDCRIDAADMVVVSSSGWSFGRQTERMDLVLPSRLVRAKAPRTVRTLAPGSDPREEVLKLAKRSQVLAEVRMEGTRVLARDLLQLKPGQVLRLPHPVGRALDLTINGKSKFKGQVVSGEHTLRFQIEQFCEVGR